MPDSIQFVTTPSEISSAALRLRETAKESILPREILLDICEQWSRALDAPSTREIPGAAFLRLWLRRSNLETLLLRELGSCGPDDSWSPNEQTSLKPFPLGVIGHWPAANISIQPILSLTCALLGGNASLVRVPTGLVDATRLLAEQLCAVDGGQHVVERIAFLSFDHSRLDLQEAMAQSVDGAMVWGGAEAVTQIRALPFPPSARIVVFGPRLSVAAMDSASWSDPTEQDTWCRRIARDVWQFDQQACSSPQTLFIERAPQREDPAPFIEKLKRAFEEENRAHPRLHLEPALAAAVSGARASWLLADPERSAAFPTTPDWTILVGEGSRIPEPVQARTVTVMVTDDLLDVVNGFDAAVQTLGLAIKPQGRENVLAEAAARRGVDRIVRIGQMHVFGSPWDGMDLVRPLVRMVRHQQSHS